MKNLGIIVGCNSANLEVFSIVKKLEKIWNLYFDVKTNYISISDNSIVSCCGCKNCFNFGICPLDSQDKMYEIREKIMESDIIMIVSPVYLDNIPGVLKDFIDRITYWLHIFFLSGKKGIILTLSDLGGWGYVEDYLFEIMNHLGINIISKMNFDMEKYYFYNEIYLQQFFQLYLDDMISCKDNYNSTLESLFVDKRNNMKQNLTDDYKSKYWGMSGIIDCTSLKEWNKVKEGKQYD